MNQDVPLIVDLPDVWGRILEHLKSRLPEQKFETWFRKLAFLEGDASRVVLGVPNAFFADFFEQYNLPALQQAFLAVGGFSPAIVFRVSPVQLVADGDGDGRGDEPKAPPPATDPADPLAFSSPVAPPASESASAAPSGARQEPVNRSLRIGGPTTRAADLPMNGDAPRPKFTFDSFVVGRGNEFAYASCLAVAREPARSYNPLFLYGGVGLGKTHLMLAIGAGVRAREPRARIAYVSSEQFMNEMIESIQRGSTLEFRNRYRKLDMLLIDDIQFLSGKESTQDEFFHTFNTLYDANKQVVIASDRAPKDIQNLEERLISRFHWGLVSDIQPPDLETRMAILRAKAEQQKLVLPADVILEIAKLIQTNIRELEGSLIRVSAFSELLNVPISVGLVQDALSDYIRQQERRPLDVMDIQKYVAQAYGVPPESLRGKRRTSTVAAARQVAMFLTKELTDLTVVEIGRRFGNRDHSTVLHGVKKVRGQIATDTETARRLEQMRMELDSKAQM